MEEKEIEILDKVMELFRDYGFRTVSMDDVSRELRISKKTLYKYFKNKSDLIEKLLQYEQERFDEMINQEAFLKEGNAIDILLAASKCVAEAYKNASRRAIFELKKYFPEENDAFWTNRMKFIVSKTANNFRRGIEEGIYRKNLRVELEAQLYAHRLRLIHLDEELSRDLDKYSYEDIFSCFFESLIRSISNKKGVEYFESQKASMGLVD